MDSAANPFAVLSLIVAPAILTNASTVLIMSTSNRLARAADRARELSKQLEEAHAFEAPEAERRLEELMLTEQRALLLLHGLRCFYMALAGFSSATLISLLGAVLAPMNAGRVVQALEFAGVAAGLLGVACIIYASALLVRETRLAVQNIRNRIERVQRRAPLQRSP
ncbi:MAG: DUF2721 domain-containing protein [Aureliella sp.]